MNMKKLKEYVEKFFVEEKDYSYVCFYIKSSKENAATIVKSLQKLVGILKHNILEYFDFETHGKRVIFCVDRIECSINERYNKDGDGLIIFSLRISHREGMTLNCQKIKIKIQSHLGTISYTLSEPEYFNNNSKEITFDDYLSVKGLL
jgi:hypothetical protein